MRIVLIMLVLIAVCSSCKKSKDAGSGCANLGCSYSEIFAFRLVDKTTGADVMFGSNPPYTPNDIKLFYDAGRTTPLQFFADSTGKFIITHIEKDMYLEIKGTDIYKLSVTGLSVTCCGKIIKEMWQDEKLLCSSCAYVISVPIK